MPPVTRRASKALKARLRLNPHCKESFCGENDLRLCLDNYYKMRKQRRGFSERIHFSKEQELSLAQYLVTMNLEGKISGNTISSYVVPEMMRRLHEDHGITVPRDTIRAKYYALRDATKLYMDFKKNGTGMGWDSQKYTFMMDDPRWADLQQVNKDYGKFYNKNCYIYHMLEDVFRSQGATGEYTSGFVRSPRNSDEEKEMEGLVDSRRGKAKTDTETSGDDVIEVRPSKGKGKKGKGKRKSGDLSSDSPIRSPSAAAQDRYIRVLDGLETIVSRKGKKNSSSMSVSVSSPSKTKPGSSKVKEDYEIALEELVNLGLPWEVHVRMGTILKDPMETMLWKMARSDEDRIALVRMRGCFPPNPRGSQDGNESPKLVSRLLIVSLDLFMDNFDDTHGDQSGDSSDDDMELTFALFVMLGLALFDPNLNPVPRRRIRDGALSGAQWVTELINGHRDRIFDNMRMDANLFLHLCDLLLQRGYWQPHPTQRVGIHESVAIALVCLSHNERHRVLAERFNHSLETVDRHLRRCLRSLVRLGRDLVRPRNFHQTHPRILNSQKFWPWFKDCVGAIDGTHVSAWCRADQQDRFRNRHGDLSQNVLAVCDHDMRFVFVQVGWEGSAHDSRVLQRTLADPNCGFPMPPEGKYYAADAAYTNMPGFMTPFRGARGSAQEREAKALFNRRHASLRSIIERTFGVLKRRFPILRGPMQNYMMATQNNIVLACCALHNFMRENGMNDAYFDKEIAAAELDDAMEDGYQVPPPQQVDMSEAGIAAFAQDRRAIANSMYRNRFL